MKKLLLSLSLIASLTASAQWESQATGFTAQSRGLIQIKIVDANTVWGLAYDGVAGANIQECTVTTDGGNSWTAHEIDLGNPDLEINNISPVNGTTAWLSALVPAEGHGVVFKTTDGGESWIQQLETGFQEATSFLNGVYFFNENVGLAYGDPINNEYEVYRTTDGGENWTLLPAAALPNPLSGEFGYNNVPLASGNTFWFTTSTGRLYRTTDAGVTWAVHNTPIADFGGGNVSNTSGTAYFSGSGENANGYILRAVGATNPVFTYFRSFDGGKTWGTTPAAFTGTRRILNYIPGTNVIVATSADPTLFGTSISTDNGGTWVEIEAEEQRGSNAFLSPSIGWCSGFSDGPVTDGVFKLNTSLAISDAVTAKFKVYPNPASSVVTISTPDVETAKLNVTDLSGKTVMTKSLNGIENTVDISNLSTGAYFFEITANNNKEVVKILKN